MENNEHFPQKVVIVAGPSFGSALPFMLFGAAIGVAATLYGQSQNQQNAAVAPAQKLEADSVRLSKRLTKLAKNVKTLAGHAKDAAVTVGVVVAPLVHSAIEEGKKVAHLTAEEIKEELKGEPGGIYDDPPVSKDQA